MCVKKSTETNTLKFKTNINCGGCIKAVTPHLDKAEGVKSWQDAAKAWKQAFEYAEEAREYWYKQYLEEKARYNTPPRFSLN